VLLITGIANPQPLKAEIERLGARTELMQYGDHHNFTTAELDDIAGHFSKNRHTMIVTTEKDATRITQRKDLPQIVRDNIYALPIEVRFMDGEEKLFNENIYDYVTENSRDC
jgi:tetraacyldisaccharide 4'-kinase